MASLSNKQAFCHTHAAPVLTSRRPLRRPHNCKLLSQTDRHRCRITCDRRSVHTCAARQSTQSSTAQLAVTPSSQQQPFYLPRSQLANKQVVTRTDGRILGVVDHLIADPNTCKVVALSLKEPPSSDALPGDAPRQIGLMSLKQISDVLLVHDDRVLLQQQLTVGLGYVKMVGTVVKTAGGKVIGKVRDFDFSPDDGRIARLVIDALGIPALPIKLLGCSAVRIQLVQNITWNCITLAPGSEAYIDKLTTGLFDDAVNILRGAQQYTAYAKPDDRESRDDPEYVQWYLEHGRAYQQRDPTKKLAVPSDIAIQSALQERRARQPQALPPGRQPSYASQLQAEQPQLQPEPAQWPGTQQGQDQAMQQPWPGSYQQQMPLQSTGWDQRPQPIPQQQDPQLGQQQPPSWQQPQSRETTQQPSLPQLQQQAPPARPQYQSQTQYQSQQQQEMAGQTLQGQSGREAWYSNQMSDQQSPATDFYASSPSKLEQQRRYASRAGAAITEPRWDPRRRKAGTPASAPSAAAQQTQAAGKVPGGQPSGLQRPSPGYQQRDDSQNMQSGTNQAARTAPSWSGTSGYAMQPDGGSLQGRTYQPEAQQESAPQRTAERQLPASAGQQHQGSNVMPAEQSFNSWAQVSSPPVNRPAGVILDGSIDAA